jgi:Flp pilus assembly pilin Flp
MRNYLTTRVKTSLQALHATSRALARGARRGARGEEGAVTAEYAILLALIAVIAIAAMITLGFAVAALFTTGAGGVTGA